MPFAATWMDLEIIILSEVRHRQIPCDITYTWNLKFDTKTDSRRQQTHGYQRGKGGGGGIN